MKNSKRIIIGFLLVTIVLLIFYIAVSILREKEYKYFTFENEWGVSSNCYIDNDQFAVCEIDEVLVIVRQYYEI